MNKIDAARHAQGIIQLEPDSAEQVKQAIAAVSTVTASQDNQVEFEGKRIVEGHGFALQVNCFDIYECPNGYLLHTYMDTGPNWAVTGKTLKELLRKAPDQRVAKRAHGLLIQKNLIPFGH
ncbi:MAG: hypothetical protein Kow0031_09330 [Anaerolineae bacterium]